MGSPRKGRRRPGRGRVGAVLDGIPGPNWMVGLLLVLLLGAGMRFAWREGAPAAKAAIVHLNGVDRVESRAPWILEAANESGVDPHLIAAMMFCESSGRVDAVSSAEALGLLQLQVPTAGDMARRLDVEVPDRETLLSDGQLNVRLGAAYVAWLRDYLDGSTEPGSVGEEKVLIGYNAGPGRLRGWIRDFGGYAAWKAEREAAGDSQVLRYVAKVRKYRALFAERGRILAGVEE